jgi:hypothetical protein
MHADFAQHDPALPHDVLATGDREQRMHASMSE